MLVTKSKEESEEGELLNVPRRTHAEVTELYDLISRLSPRTRRTAGAGALIQSLLAVVDCDDAQLPTAAEQASARLRLLFYASIARRPPTDLRSAPAYVSSVQRRYELPSRNAAREMLAQIEGFNDWRALMRAALRG